MNLIPVEGQKDLYRDPKSNAIINTNKQDYETYIARRKNQINEKLKIEKMEDEMNKIKNDLDEIKQLLKGISNGSR